MIYLDNASTTKPADEVISEMNLYLKEFYGNPSSNHRFGQLISEKIEFSRQEVADLLKCNSSEIYFNSGATEGINTVLRGYVENNINKGNHLITSKVEHKAVLETCAYLENIGVEITYLDVDNNGLIDLDQLISSIRDNTLLVSIIWFNNETGVIQSLERISKIVANTNVKLFVDATQVVGKTDFNVKKLNIDMLCLSAHKFYGPKGVGALYVKNGIKISSLLYGGGQERNFRSGTTNVPGIIGLGKACEIVKKNNNVIEIKRYLEKKLLMHFDCKIIGKDVSRSDYITNVIIKDIDADVIIGKLQKTIISTGSACTSRIIEPSHVLKAMGYSDDDCFSSLRFSLGINTNIDDIDTAIEELMSIL